MRNDLNNIDDLFRAGLGGYSEVPPPDVWVALEQRLDNDKKKRPFGWRWFIMAMLCAGAGGSMFAWRMATRGDGAPSASQASIASVQQAQAPQGKSAGNTSAATESSTAATSGNSVNHKHHKHNNNAAATSPTVADAATNNTTANSIPDNNSNSIAGNSTPLMASAAEPTGNRQEERAANKAAAIQYIRSNRQRNNINVAESDEYAPTVAASNYTDASDEDNATFGRRPSVDMDEPAYSQATTPKVVTPAYTSSVPRSRKARNANRRGNPNAINFSMGAKPIVRNTPTTTNAVAHNDQPTGNTAKPTATAANTTGAVTITTPLASATPARKSSARKDRTSTVTTATTPAGSVAAKNTPAQVVPASSAKPAAATPATVAKVGTPASSIAAKPASSTKPAVIPAKTSTTKPAVAVTTAPAAKATTVKVATQSVETTTPAVAVQKKITGRRPARKQAGSATPTGIASVKTSTPGKAITAKPASTTSTAKQSKPSVASAPVAGKVAVTPPKRLRARTKQAAAATPAIAVNTTAATTGTTPAAKRTKRTNTVNRLASAGAATPKSKPATPVVAAKQPAPKPARTKNPTPATTKPAVVVASATQPPTIVPAAKSTIEAPAPKVTTPPVPAAAPKPADTTPVAAAPAPTDSITGKKHLFKGITYGIKGGYEGGFSGNASRKVVIAPYFEKQLSGKFSLMAQPALKISKVQANNLSGTQNYYSIDPNSKVTVLDSALIPVIQNNQQMGYLVRVNLAYHEQHDSIVKSYATGGSYVEMELPIMLKYAINPKLSVYGGINLNYSRYVAIKEKTFIAQSITVDDTTFTILPSAAPSIRNVLQYSGANINSYSGPLYNNQSGGIFRMGMMLGASYEFRKRWMIDAMITKNAAKANVQGGYDVNKPLSATYFRFTLGYRLSK